MNKNADIKSITEGALLAGLTAILAISGVYIPFLGAVTSMIWTIPIVVAVVRHGLSIGILATIVAGIIMFLSVSPLTAIFLIIQYGGLGLLFGYLFKNQASAGRTLLLGAIVAGISFAISFNLFMLVTGADLNSMQKELSASMETVVEMYRNMGLFNSDNGFTEAEFRKMFDFMVQAFVVLIPGLVIIYGIVVALVNFLLGRVVLKRLGAPITKLPSFSEWRLPWYLVYGVIIALGTVVLGNKTEVDWLVKIGVNILYVYLPILLILGVSVFTYFYKSWKLTKAFRLMIIVFFFLYFNFWFTLLPFIGLFDLVLNFRRLGDEKPKE